MLTLRRYQSRDVEEPPLQELTPECCREKARALAADRTTTLVPVITAQLIFISAYAISYYRTFAAASGPSNWWNVEIHSIAFSLTVLWVIVAVLLGSLIGVSQSEQAVARILHRLGDHDQSECAIAHGSLQRRESFWNSVSPLETRIFNGGIPSWRPDKWKSHPLPVIVDQELKTPKLSAKASASKVTPFLCAFSLLIVSVGPITAFTLSGLVPPEGFGARHLAQATILTVWLASFLLQYVVARCNIGQRLHFWIVFSKDIMSTISNVFVILITQWGILNRCDSWTHWGKTGLKLVNIVEVHDVLLQRSKKKYPAIIFSGIAIQLACCGVVAWWYRHALRVYLQRDDGRSNLRHVRRASWSSGRLLGGDQKARSPGEDGREIWTRHCRRVGSGLARGGIGPPVKGHATRS
jgi:hypothetical protein